MADSVLEVENLVKDFGSFRAVDRVSFTVPKGKVVGLLGPNGAGKTTTIHILLGITSATSGNIRYFGKNFYTSKNEILQQINYASAFNTLQGRISVWENLVVFALLYNVKEYKKIILNLISQFEASDLLYRRYMDLSSGQKTRINLIKALINDPKVILLDEPTASLDPDIADKTLSFIEQLKKERDLTLLYTSHNMSEITRICDDVVFLDHGKIVAHDTPLGLTKRITTAELRITFDTGREKIEKYLTDEQQKYEFKGDHTLVLTTEETKIPATIFDISKIGIWITDIEINKPTLEDVFLHIARRDTNESE